MEPVVFFSWQSDADPARGKLLLERVLTSAAERIAADTTSPFRPTVDQDTRGIPGSPAMITAILKKLDACSILVADVSLTFRRSENGPRSPNPNVLVELGYGLKRLGTERILLILDSVTGRPEQLPFDLRGNRVITYDSAAADGDASERALTSEIENELRLILQTAGPPGDIAPPVHIDLQFSKENIGQDRHDYRLHVTVSNGGVTVLRNWVAEVRFPRALLNPQRSYPIVQAPSSDGRVTMRIAEANHSGPIFPGEPKEVFGIDYIMTHELHDNQQALFSQLVEAVLYADGAKVASASRRVKDLQFF